MTLSTPLRLLVIAILSMLLTMLFAMVALASQVFAAPATETPPVSLRPQVVVEAAVVRLEDVFEGVGAEGGRVIARAPRPGQKSTLEARWLWRTAHRHGLDWRPLSRHDTVTVERASTTITADEIVAMLSSAMDERVAAGDSIEIELDSRDMVIHLPVGDDRRLTVGRLDYDPRSGRLSAVLAGAGDDGTRRIPVAGKVYRLTEAPVPNRRLSVGHIIRERDLHWITVRAKTLDRNALVDEVMIVGQAARRPLAEGRPIRSGDVEAPQLVQRKSMVTITLEMPNMKLTAQGRALEDGALGDVIRVENTQSRRTIEATVTGANAVNVTAAHLMLLQ